MERERLLAVLESRTASHEERKRAREALEAEVASDEPEHSGVRNGTPQTIAEDLHTEVRLQPDLSKSG